MGSVFVKYGIWNIAMPKAEEVAQLEAAGYGPLTARVLSGRGIASTQEAAALLRADGPLHDPFEMKEMDRAVAAIRQALEAGTRIAIFGDYDVDGITATCLLADYLRGLGADCLTHIPGRLEEGYGLNRGAIAQLYEDGVGMIITVDCGITAVEEAELCRSLGITLVVTDHHECKPVLPRAAAVVDPHRPDRTYPHTNLSGVGIAFKLAAALEGDQEAIAQRYCDLFCLGTIADVMPLCGENRALVMRGLAQLQTPRRTGLRALIQVCECGRQEITASTIGYVLAPRINAAGRMERAELAVQLFLTRDPDEAMELAETLCRLNRERQATESEIYHEAVAQLRGQKDASAIVLAGERWHQGVVGIVASRLSEEFCRPTFLICLSGDKGKASSRSYGGFNLFASLTELGGLLEGFGGHELAAGFTIERKNIDEFRRRICACAARFSASGQARTALEIDCEVPARLLTEAGVDALRQLEPCGTGCPRALLCLCETTVERVGTVGNGRHLRLRIRGRDGTSLQAIGFSLGAQAATIHVGDRLDLAFHPQINEFRGVRSVQLNLIDLRPSSETDLYERWRRGVVLSAYEKSALAPQRGDVTDVWHYLTATDKPDGLQVATVEFCTAVADHSHGRHSIRKTLACLDILAELGFLQVRRREGRVEIHLLPQAGRNPLENSLLYRTLRGD